MIAPAAAYVPRHDDTATRLCVWCRTEQLVADLMKPYPDRDRLVCKDGEACVARYAAALPVAEPPSHPEPLLRIPLQPEPVSGRSEPRTVLPVGFAHHVTWHHDDHGIYATCLPCGPARHHIEDGHPTAALVRFDTEHSS